MKKNNYKITNQFNEEQYEQSDFGRIYYNTPKVHYAPETIEALAVLLKEHNEKNEPVTIRNTGHSTNGQTLTDGVQIGLEKLKWVTFDAEKLTVSVGAGTSWDQMLKGINFPKYSPGVFPNNPGQRIHVGGTAAVGGIGFLSFKYGGFWNIVEEITLVTMEGKILKCSRTENPDYFKFSLGGFGRIGVMAEIQIRVHCCKPKVLAASIFYTGHTHFFEETELAMQDTMIDSITLLRSYVPIPFTHEKFLTSHILNILCEVENEEEAKEKAAYIKEKYHHGEVFFAKTADGSNDNLETFAIMPHTIPIEDIAYWYPEDKSIKRMDCPQVWGEYLLPRSADSEFTCESEKIMAKYDLSDGLVKIPIGFKNLSIGFYGAYTVKKISTDFDFPLSLDLKNEEISYLFGTLLSLPREKVPEGLKMVGEISDLAFRLGGKRYMYGSHELTKEQVEQQYGKDVIEKWQELKNVLDPKHLLNIDVIEHLDT